MDPDLVPGSGHDWGRVVDYVGKMSYYGIEAYKGSLGSSLRRQGHQAGNEAGNIVGSARDPRCCSAACCYCSD